MKKKKIETISQNNIEELLMAYYSCPADFKFGRLLGERLKERANAIYLAKILQEKVMMKKSVRFGFIPKWQLAFLAAFLGVLIVGAGTAMAVPAVREIVRNILTPKGTVVVNSDPVGAEVWVGPVNYGSTPVEIKLTSGKYDLKISKPNFEDYKTAIVVKENKRLDVFAVLTEYENEIKYLRKEAWNLYQDPYMVYQLYFPYDWDYKWDSFSENEFHSSTVEFRYGETVYTKVYYTKDISQILTGMLECSPNCKQEDVEIAKDGETIQGDMFQGRNKITHRNTFLFGSSVNDVGYNGYIVVESNSRLVKQFVSKMKVFTKKHQFNWLSYNNEKFGLSFKYPEGWELFEALSGGYVQVAARDGVFSVTVGGVNTEADNTVKSEEVYIFVGNETVKGVKRYYDGSDYYTVQANVKRNNWIYGIEYRYKDDLWIDVMTNILMSVEITSPQLSTPSSTPESVSYSIENVKAVSDLIFPENKIRCGDGVFVEGVVYEDVNGKKKFADGIWLAFKVKVGDKEKTNFPPIYVNDGHFVFTSSYNRFRILSPYEGDCGEAGATLSVSIYGREDTLWSQYFETVPTEIANIETGVEGVVRAGNAGVSSAKIEIAKDGVIVSSGKSDAGGYFKFSLPPGSYVLTAITSDEVTQKTSIGFDVSPGKLTYLDVNIGGQNIEKSGIKGIKLEEGSIMGYVNDGEYLKEGVTIKLRNGEQVVVAHTVTDPLGRFRFDGLAPNTHYDLVVAGSSIQWQRWEFEVEGKHIVPSGGTLRVELVVGQ